MFGRGRSCKIVVRKEKLGEKEREGEREENEQEKLPEVCAVRSRSRDLASVKETNVGGRRG